MSRFYLHRIILFLILSFALGQAEAQQATVVKATIDKNHILIGEPVELTLEARIPINEPIRFFYTDTIPHFEFLKINKIDTTDKGTETILKQVIRLTSFDSGHWAIPALILTEGIQTDSLAIDVVFSEFDAAKPYHDIKDVLDVKQEASSQSPPWWWYVAGVALLLLLLVIYFITRKKKKPEAPVVKRLSPYEEAMAALQRIRQQKPDPKEYYSQLSEIFRRYISGRAGINSLQQTTDDLLLQLRHGLLQKEIFDKLSQALLLGDFVKFARYTPQAAEDDFSFEVIVNAIEAWEQEKIKQDSLEAARVKASSGS